MDLTRSPLAVLNPVWRHEPYITSVTKWWHGKPALSETDGTTQASAIRWQWGPLGCGGATRVTRRHQLSHQSLGKPFSPIWSKNRGHTSLQHHGSHWPSASQLHLNDFSPTEEDVSPVVLHAVGFPGHRTLRERQGGFSNWNTFTWEQQCAASLKGDLRVLSDCAY